MKIYALQGRAKGVEWFDLEAPDYTTKSLYPESYEDAQRLLDHYISMWDEEDDGYEYRIEERDFQEG